MSVMTSQVYATRALLRTGVIVISESVAGAPEHTVVIKNSERAKAGAR